MSAYVDIRMPHHQQQQQYSQKQRVQWEVFCTLICTTTQYVIRVLRTETRSTLERMQHIVPTHM